MHDVLLEHKHEPDHGDEILKDVEENEHNHRLKARHVEKQKVDAERCEAVDDEHGDGREVRSPGLVDHDARCLLEHILDDRPDDCEGGLGAGAGAFH